MSDRIKTVRGRKRASNKGHPPPSAADLFDSLMQDKPDDPKTKQVRMNYIRIMFDFEVVHIWLIISESIVG